jgi:hypothetical protein
MILEPDDAERFFKLHKALTLFANQRLKLAKPPARSKGIVSLPPDQRLKVRDALVEHLDLIGAFVEENPYKLDPDELGIVGSWKDLVAGEFYVLRFLKRYTVFLTAKEPTVAYGVVALSDPFDEVIDQPLPFYCKTVLLPFQDRIVYDGLLSGYNVIIGSNMTRELNDAYKDAKKRHGVVTSLPWHPETPKTVAERSTARKKRGKRGGGLVGRWRITWMEMWDQSFVDAEVEGFVRFDDDGSGEFQFGYVHGYLNYQVTEHNDKPAVAFTFEGNDEMDPCSGRGWAFRKGDRIGGKIVLHPGDASKFKAEMTPV